MNPRTIAVGVAAFAAAILLPVSAAHAETTGDDHNYEPPSYCDDKTKGDDCQPVTPAPKPPKAVKGVEDTAEKTLPNTGAAVVGPLAALGAALAGGGATAVALSRRGRSES